MSDTYKNPVQRGFFPDPSVIRVNDDFYMVNSSFQYFPAIPVSHSKDMIHWHIIGYAVAACEWLDLSNIPDSHGIWAPDISYHDGIFYIFATLRLNGDGTRGNNVLRRQLMVQSKNPEGPYSRPSWLEVDDIDPSHFIDADGTHYLIIAPGVRAVQLSEDCSRIVAPPRVVWAGTGEPCSEGPHLLLKDGWYYAIVAEGGTGYGHGCNAARSKSLFGTYEPSPYNPVMRQTDTTALIQRAGHGKLVQIQGGSWWMYYLCGRRNGGNFTTIGRESALDPVRFTGDGWFVVNEGRGPSAEQKFPPLAPCIFPVNTVDSFDARRLALEWQFVRNPDYGTVSLDERPGWLRLYTCDGQLFERRAKNTLVRRETEHQYTAETVLDFYPEKNGEQAGLTCYYSTRTYIRWSLCYEAGRKLQLVINKNAGEELVAEIPAVPLSPVYLRVAVDGQTRVFSWSDDGTAWNTGGTVSNCFFLSDEGVPEDRKRHTGTLVGLYANNGGCGSRIPADFDFFRITV